MIWVARVAAVGTLYGYYVFSTQGARLVRLSESDPRRHRHHRACVHEAARRTDDAVCRRAWKAQSPPQIEGVDQASSRKY